MGAACATCGEKTGKYRVTVGMLERKSPFEKPTCRWRDNIKIDFKEVYWENLD
jgi:hypothetical protein